MSTSVMIAMAAEHNCLHEEQIQNQSRIIERLDAELGYKKQRLDDLKEDNRRMEEKIDDIKDCMDKIVLKSTTDDSKLEKRLVAIETEQTVMKSEQNKKIAIVGVVLALLTFYFNYLR